MSGLRKIYLGLAIIGAIWPFWPIFIWLAENGWSFPLLQDEWRGSSDSIYITSAINGEMLIAGVTLGVWVVGETYVRKNWSALWAVPITFLVGVNCGLPLYLFLRTRPVV